MVVMKIWVLLLLSATVSDAVVRYGCYSSPGSQCTNVTLKCFGNDIISLGQDIQLGTSSNNNCQSEEQCRNNLCCLPEKKHKPIRADLQDRLSMFTSCSNQQSCTVTVPYNQSLPYGYVSYSYACLNAAVNLDISTNFDIDVKKQVYVYGNGNNYSLLNSTRICKVQTETQFIAVEALYINLRSESCKKIEISSQNKNLFNCTEEQLVILSEKLDITGNQINITIHNLTLQADEFIWLEFLTDDDAEISIRCKSIDQATTSTPPSTVTFATVEASHQESHINITAIVGGVLGTALIISICIIIFLVIYFKGRNKKTESQQQVTQNGHEYTTVQNTVGDSPTTVYDSLNTRQQTGYYNMGSINQYDRSRPDITVDSQQQAAATTGDSPQQKADATGASP